MNSKDYLLREIEKISAVVSHLLGLKEAGKTDEFMELAASTILNEFHIHMDELLELPLDEFRHLLDNGNYNEDKLDALAALLYLTFDLDDIKLRNATVLNKVISIFDLLETKYHWQSFDNIQKRNIISALLSQS